MCTTRSTPSTCTPRAATSVATRTFESPATNSARLRSRAFCDRLPCSSTAGMPAAVSCFASFFAWCFMRVKKMRRAVPEASASMSESFAPLPETSNTWCVSCGTTDSAESTECMIGECRYFLTRLSTPLSSVALKSRRWPCLGVLFMMRVTTGRNPMSAMWSASSRTVISTPSRLMTPCFMRSSRRPGAATTMSTPASSAASWRRCGTPPKIVVTLMPTGSASILMVSASCVTSSRVGASTIPRGRLGRRFFAASSIMFATSGMPKAIDLPEPVRPRPRTSRPARVSTSVSR